MKEIPAHWLRWEFEFPAKAEPAWKHLVDRWYQLDRCAYVLAQAGWEIREKISTRPDLMFLASPGASNETDRSFVEGAATSPAKFVHTLPNVRSSSLCQVLEWSGPMFCLQRDPNTLGEALSEAATWVTQERPNVWVFSAGKEGEAGVVRLWMLGSRIEGLPRYCLFRCRQEGRICDPEPLNLCHGWAIRKEK